MKFHDDRCKRKAVMRRKPKCGRQTDGQTDMVIPVYPPYFVAGGIKMVYSYPTLNTHTYNVLCINGIYITIYYIHLYSNTSSICLKMDNLPSCCVIISMHMYPIIMHEWHH